MRRRLLIAALAWIAFTAPTIASAQAPDARGEEYHREPQRDGERASAPIPPEMHVRNEEGSGPGPDGLCVISSVLANGMYQRVPGMDIDGPDDEGQTKAGKGSDLWRTAKGRWGGYSPSKLEALIAETNPAEKWGSYVGADPSILDDLSRQGYPIGATMNTGRLYRYAPIHHMVSLIHYRTGGQACVVDNNNPGVYSWMPAVEFAKRWIDGGTGWAFVWTRRPPSLSSRVLIIALAVAAVLVLTRRPAVATAS
jgi:hypothetical protein